MNWDDPNQCLEAVKENGYALQYVKKQTPEICLETVKHYINAKDYIKIPLTQDLIYQITVQVI